MGVVTVAPLLQCLGPHSTPTAGSELERGRRKASEQFIMLKKRDNGLMTVVSFFQHENEIH